MCTNQDISNIPFIMRGNHFLVHGHKKDLPHITCIFHLLKYVAEIVLVSAIRHHISLLRRLPKSYFKRSTFQPNFLCSSFFKKQNTRVATVMGRKVNTRWVGSYTTLSVLKNNNLQEGIIVY